MGSLHLFLSQNFWKTRLTLMQRISYLTGMLYYTTTGLAAVTHFLPSLFLLLFHPEKIFWFNLLFSVPSFLFTYIYMRYWMKLPMNVDVLRVRQVSYFAHLFALRDLLLGTLEEWKPTGVRSTSARFESFSFLFTWLTLFIPIITVLLTALRLYEGYDPTNFLLLLFFTSFHSYVTLPILKDL
jgi:hypothetical protein